MSAEAIPVAFERIPSTPPVIAPVASQARRPLWSVMMPTYNCLAYLQEAMESVLIQAPGPEQMQIMVLDDCSTDGDVQALVATVGKGRIGYFRQAHNVGSLRNFEACLNHSAGQWVHILHGDDRVAPGFYDEIEMLFRRYPEAGAAFTGVKHIVGPDWTLFPGHKLMDEPGILKDFAVGMAESVKVQPPAIVVKRSVYEQLGGFFAVHYGEDWEMWTRIAAHFPVAYSPKFLAHYRYLTGGSITQHSIQSGQNLLDISKVIDIMQTYLPAATRDQAKKKAQRNYSQYCSDLAQSLYHTNSRSAFLQAKGALKMSLNRRVVYNVVKLYVKHIIHYKELRKLWNELG